jgi:hypothetical protein
MINPEKEGLRWQPAITDNDSGFRNQEDGWMQARASGESYLKDGRMQAGLWRLDETEHTSEDFVDTRWVGGGWVVSR